MRPILNPRCPVTTDYVTTMAGDNYYGASPYFLFSPEFADCDPVPCPDTRPVLFREAGQGLWSTLITVF